MRHRLPKTLLSSVALWCAPGTDGEASAALASVAVSPVAVSPVAVSPVAVSPAAAYLEQAQRSAEARTNCAATADDVVGDLTLRLWNRHREYLEQFDPQEDGAYLERCVQNRLRDEWRRQKRHTATFETVSGESDVDELLHQLPIFDDPQESASVKEFRASLSRTDQEVLELLEQGHSERDIARSMDRTRHQVRKSLTRIAKDAERYLG